MKDTKKVLFIIIVILAVVTIVYAASSILQNDQQTKNENDNIIKNDTTNTTTETVLAIVNGENITSTNVTKKQQNYAENNTQLTEKQALELLINETLILQQSKQEKYNISDEEAETKIQQQLQEENVTLETYKQEVGNATYYQQLQDYKEQLAVQLYLNESLKNSTVTEQEKIDYYNMLKEESPEEIKPYDELKDQIENYLEQRKRRDALDSLIKDLRKQATIEYKDNIQ